MPSDSERPLVASVPAPVTANQVFTRLQPEATSSTVTTAASSTVGSQNPLASSSVSETTSRIHTTTTSNVTTSTGGSVLQAFQDPSRYEEHSVIGNGAFGTVYRALDKMTSKIVALKKMRFSLTEDGVPMAILREISLLKQLEKFDHPNIVRLLDICHGQRHEREMSLFLVFEHVHQDLALYLERCPPPGLGQENIKHLIWQILSGVDFLHSHRIVHRDLKPHNILVTKDGTVKLTDFGLARIYEFYTLLTTTVVTLWYRSPEVLMGLSYATPVDIWSCGCIFAELFIRTKALFPGLYEMDQLCKIFETIGTPSESEWPEKAGILRNNFQPSTPKEWGDICPEMDSDAKDLIKKMLAFTPSNRITANEALMHPYFADYYSDHPSTSSANTSRSMRSDFDSSLNFSSHDESGGSLGDTSGASARN